MLILILVLMLILLLLLLSLSSSDIMQQIIFTMFANASTADLPNTPLAVNDINYELTTSGHLINYKLVLQS